MTPKLGKKHTKKDALNLELNIVNIRGKEVEKVKLDNRVFDGKINPSLMHQAVVTYLANQRKGLACAKTRGEVRGGGRKPWRQKGTGRARVGSIRSPIWRGGGVTFGPRPHSFRKDLPKKMRILALKSAFNAKLKDEQILILSELVMDSHKTKDFSKIIDKLKLNKGRVRFVVEKIENNLKLATRNIKTVFIARASDINAKEVIDCKRLVLTKEALKKVQERIKNVGK